MDQAPQQKTPNGVRGQFRGGGSKKKEQTVILRSRDARLTRAQDRVGNNRHAGKTPKRHRFCQEKSNSEKRRSEAGIMLRIKVDGISQTTQKTQNQKEENGNVVRGGWGNSGPQHRRTCPKAAEIVTVGQSSNQ